MLRGIAIALAFGLTVRLFVLASRSLDQSIADDAAGERVLAWVERHEARRYLRQAYVCGLITVGLFVYPYLLHGH